MNKKENEQSNVLNKTLDSLTKNRQTPKSVYAALCVLYIVTSVAVSITAGSGKVIMLGSTPVPVYTYAGVLSSVANLCIILITVFFGKLGFVTSITVISIQVPLLLFGIIAKHRMTSLPGLFGYLLTVIAVVMIYRNNKEVAKYQLKMREQATTDILTGLPNRFAGAELFDDLIKRKKPFVAVAIDVNEFKSINDTMGFNIGNKVLIEIGSRWKKIADTGLSGTLDFILRIGGDEYALIIRNYESDEDIINTIKQYNAALDEKMSIDGYDFSVTASFGYAKFPDDSEERDLILSYSATAMKEIKRLKSGEHIMHFTPELLKDQNKMMIDGKVRDALDNDTIYYNLQPQYDMSHRLRGFEALARIKDDEGNLISPADFIPAAERMGLIDRIDLAVYKKAAMFFGELLRKSGANITLSINVSVKHLMKSSFMDEIRNILKESGVPADKLELEITESIMIESADKASDCLKELKEMGVKIAIDDFGTGYSSLSYLNSFPIDLLKVDKSFIDIMNESDSSKQYVEAIISLGHIMGFEVIAEGVEEEAQLETLRSINCDYIQGFIWGRPLPSEEAARLIE